MRIAPSPHRPRDLRLGLIFILTCLGAVVPAIAGAATPAHLWSQRFGDNNENYARAVATDAAGNVYLAGDAYGTFSFGGSNLTCFGGSRGVYLAKFNAFGVHQWSSCFGVAGSGSYGYAVATDGSGSVYLTGDLLGSISFGGGTLTSAGGTDIYIAKFNSSGLHQWSQRYGDASGQAARSIAVDASNNVYITGNFSGTVNFGGSLLTSAGLTDIYLAKFNSAGTHQWSQRFGDASAQTGYGVATDATSNVYLAGFSAGTVNFGGSNLTSAGGQDISIACFNSSGTHQWSQRFGDASDQFALDIATDPSGNVCLTGQFAGTVNFGGSNLTSAGINDVFLARFNTSGVHQWSKRFGNASDQIGTAVTTNAAGDVFLTGYFAGIVNLGGANLTSAGNNDIFIGKFNTSGVHQWSQRFGDSSNQLGNAIATDASGNVCLAGHFLGTVNFGGASFTSLSSLLEDIFLVKFGGESAEPLINDIVDVGNDQGRRVRIHFAPSGADDPVAVLPIQQYEAFRRIDPLPAAAPGNLRDAPGATDAIAQAALPPGNWEFAGSIPAHAEQTYFMTAPTDADSTISLGQHYSAFFIRASTDAPSTFFDSPPDSGYSLDNLAPGVPASFAYAAGNLTWEESTATDFDYFSVYGSSSSSFASATFIEYSVAPTVDVSTSPYNYYFVTATDFSGNEGKPAVINAVSGVGENPRQYVLSVSAYPNPFNPRTTIRYTLPSHGHVTVSIYDARGAQVSVLWDGERRAGAYTIPWDGRNESGTVVSSGLYYARVGFGGETQAYKMLLLK